MEIFFTIIVVCGLLGLVIDNMRGLLLGAVLGPFGVLIAALLKGK